MKTPNANGIGSAKAGIRPMTESFEYLKHESMRDVVRILDTAFLKGNELMPQYRAMQIANRALIAHHAIEKGLKARLEKAGLHYPKSTQKGHDLYHLYKLTKQINNGKWADDLANSYQDAVSFYEYDLELAPHIETLETYLMEVGSGDAFKEMRYWIEDNSPGDDSVASILRISLHLHREILEALSHLVASDQQRLVSERVEQTVSKELRRAFIYSPGTSSEQAVKLLLKWLQTKPNLRTALKEAVQQDYLVEEIDELGRQNLRKAFEGLNATDKQSYAPPPPSADPAVSFYIGACGDIPPSLPGQYPDVEVQVKWQNEQHTSAALFSPGGEVLGYISRHIQSRWFVEPIFNNRAAFYKSFEDAKHWMIAHNCKRVSVNTAQQVRQLHIHSQDDFFPLPISNVVTDTIENVVTDTIEMDKPQEFELNFWDEKHDLQTGQQVTITLNFDESSGAGDHLQGVISRVEHHKVWITGQKWF